MASFESLNQPARIRAAASALPQLFLARLGFEMRQHINTADALDRAILEPVQAGKMTLVSKSLDRAQLEQVSAERSLETAQLQLQQAFENSICAVRMAATGVHQGSLHFFHLLLLYQHPWTRFRVLLQSSKIIGHCNKKFSSAFPRCTRSIKTSLQLRSGLWLRHRLEAFSSCGMKCLCCCPRLFFFRYFSVTPLVQLPFLC